MYEGTSDRQAAELQFVRQNFSDEEIEKDLGGWNNVVATIKEQYPMTLEEMNTEIARNEMIARQRGMAGDAIRQPPSFAVGDIQTEDVPVDMHVGEPVITRDMTVGEPVITQPEVRVAMGEPRISQPRRIEMEPLYVEGRTPEQKKKARKELEDMRKAMADTAVEYVK